jgi:hypothetical protein
MRKPSVCEKCKARACGGCANPKMWEIKYRRGKPPKDGTRVVGWWRGRARVASYLSDNGGKFYWVDDDGKWWDGDPSKWMLLP